MRFADFLRVAVLLFGGAGTALAIVAIAGASGEDSTLPVYVAVGWWVLAAVAGLWLGRRDAPTQQIGRLLAGARNTNALPEVEPGAVVFNRLWPLAAVTLVSGASAFLLPQIPAIAAGYAIAVALTWRKQASAVTAIEERDGVRFYFDRSSPLGAPKLLRTPGLRRVEPSPGSPRAADSV
jgi:MYXO-CTERM domain-containing protein